MTKKNDAQLASITSEINDLGARIEKNKEAIKEVQTSPAPAESRVEIDEQENTKNPGTTSSDDGALNNPDTDNKESEDKKTSENQEPKATTENPEIVNTTGIDDDTTSKGTDGDNSPEKNENESTTSTNQEADDDAEN